MLRRHPKPLAEKEEKLDLRLRGVYTALITPFDERGNLDEAAFRNLIDFQIDNGIDGIVPCGTTGESPTLSHEEHDRVIEIAIEQAKKKNSGRGRNGE